MLGRDGDVKNKTILKTILVSIVLIFIFMLANSWVIHTSSATIIIETDLPKVPSYMYVLETVTKEITKEQALDIASSIFNVTGYAQFTNGAWKITDGSREVLIYKSGTIKYFDNSKMWNSKYLPQNYLQP